jgi:hypothetical protein
MQEGKKEIILHFTIAAILTAVIQVIWLIKGGVPLTNYIQLILGFAIGSMILDLDHLVYWYFLYPDKEESIQGKNFLKERKFKQAFTLIGENHKTHTSLVFHHIYFQLVLVLVSFFIFLSTGSMLGKSLVLFMNLHLLTDQWQDYKNLSHLKNWLFARVDYTLSDQGIKIFLGVMTFLFSILFYLIVR